MRDINPDKLRPIASQWAGYIQEYCGDIITPDDIYEAGFAVVMDSKTRLELATLMARLWAIYDQRTCDNTIAEMQDSIDTAYDNNILAWCRKWNLPANIVEPAADYEFYCVKNNTPEFWSTEECRMFWEEVCGDFRHPFELDSFTDMPAVSTFVEQHNLHQNSCPSRNC